MTPIQISEIKNCLDPVTGPEYFIDNFIVVQAPTMGLTPLSMYPCQRQYLRNAHDNTISLSLMSRQLGKTTIAAAYILWRAIFNPDTSHLTMSINQASAIGVLDRISLMDRHLPSHLKVRMRVNNRRYIEFDNGSRIVTSHADDCVARGQTFNTVHLDEYASYKPAIAENIWNTVMPVMCAKSSKLIISTSPSPEKGKCRELWENNAIDILPENATVSERLRQVCKNLFRSKNDNLSLYMATWEDHPSLDASWAQQQQGLLHKDTFAREFECKFV